tara:strand:+ start:54 stop:278 length:225 start_codon:yes stop_codon:yes gene_type:complete
MIEDDPVKRIRVRELKEGDEFTCIEFIRVRVTKVGSMEVQFKNLHTHQDFTRHQFSTLPISIETMPERFKDVRD